MWLILNPLAFFKTCFDFLMRSLVHRQKVAKRISGPGEKPAQTHSQGPQGAKISLFKRKHVGSDPENKATIAAYDCINKNCII